MLARVAAAPGVASVVSPYSARGAAQVSRDGQIAYATVVFDAQANSLPAAEVTHVVHLAEAARAPGLQVDLGGQAVENALRPSVGISAAVGVDRPRRWCCSSRSGRSWPCCCRWRSRSPGWPLA